MKMAKNFRGEFKLWGGDFPQNQAWINPWID